MSSTTTDDRLPVLAGGVAGVVAWLVGYALTFLIVADGIRDSPLSRFLEAFEGEPTTYEMVGWVFYNAHLVDTVFEDVPLIGSYATTFVGGEGFTSGLYAVPIVLLFVAGVGLALYCDSPTPTDGLFTGVAAVPGYLVLTVAGVFVFEVTVAGASGSPDAIPGVVLAGLVYPVIFAGAGGVAGAVLAGRP